MKQKTSHYVPDRGRKRRGDRPSFMRREDFEAMAERERAIHGSGAGMGDAAGVGENPDRPGGTRG